LKCTHRKVKEKFNSNQIEISKLIEKESGERPSTPTEEILPAFREISSSGIGQFFRN